MSLAEANRQLWAILGFAVAVLMLIVSYCTAPITSWC